MFDSIVYSKRRQALREQIGNGIIYFLGTNEMASN